MGARKRPARQSTTWARAVPPVQTAYGFLSPNEFGVLPPMKGGSAPRAAVVLEPAESGVERAGGPHVQHCLGHPVVPADAAPGFGEFLGVVLDDLVAERRSPNKTSPALADRAGGDALIAGRVFSEVVHPDEPLLLRRRVVDEAVPLELGERPPDHDPIGVPVAPRDGVPAFLSTVLQHAWATISHKLDYKSEVDVPRELRRSLFRLSALLELADKEFVDLRRRTEELQERMIARSAPREVIEVPLYKDPLEDALEAVIKARSAT